MIERLAVDTNAAVGWLRSAASPPVETVAERCPILYPDVDTARSYGKLRARLQLQNIGTSKMNDVWIAALCIQHDLPLLTNDHGFDSFAGLRVIHW